MTTFQPIILQCPGCKQQMYNYELVSYTIHNSTVYSDSKTITDMFVDDDRALRICPSCNQPLWVEDAIVEVENPYEFVDTIPKALDVHDLPFNMSETFMQGRTNFYEKLLKQGLAYSSEKKYYLRTRLWWSMNDLIRDRLPFLSLVKEMFHRKMFWRLIEVYLDQKKIFKSYGDLFKDNLTQLIKLTDPNTDDDYFMLAEMYRELGQFNKANRTMRDISLNSLPIRKLRRQIFLRRKNVFKL